MAAIVLVWWGMFPASQAKYTKAWYNEQREPSYDAEYLHGVLQRLNFGPELN